VYPFFESGYIVISGDEGFHLVKESNLSVNDNDSDIFSLSPNPANSNVTISSKSAPIFKIEAYNVLGQQVLNQEFSETTSKNINISSLKSGIYLLKVNSNTTKRLIVK
jgi:hypothetical protein